MTVYDPYTNTFYDNSKKQDVITSDKTMIPVQSLKKNFCPNCGTKMVEPQETKQPEISSYYGLKSYLGR